MMFLFNYETLVDPILRDLREFIPEFSGMKAGDKVIDVCCGTGAQVLEYGRRGMVATGIDIDPNMLKTATTNMKRQKALNAFFLLGDAANLPFPQGHFDYASISMALHDKEKSLRYQIIAEMKRVVKPDGALILIDYEVPLPMNVWAWSARAIEFIAGGSHYQGFKDYLASGGLEDILKKPHLREEHRTYFKRGLLTAVKVINTP